MIIKYFDEFNGLWLDITGNTGSTLTKGAEEWTTTQGYSVLTLLISQTGTDAPTYTELENTTGSTYSLNRNGAGQYTIDFDDTPLSQGKTFIQIQQSDTDIIQIYRNDTSTIKLFTNGDSVLDFTSFELRIYN